jgi:hypothetical protein|tara:strand:+ start:381 stop:578 length:198 start_codon:yes stop_codon:yes gene_type:complete
MSNNQDLDNSVKFRPDYKWPKKGSKRNCPKCDKAMQLQENLNVFFGKPWWCHSCQWQFSEEDLAK